MIYNSKTYRVYSRVAGEIKDDRLTHRAVAVYCSWLLEKSINELRAVLETSGPDGCVFVQLALDRMEEVYNDIYQARAGAYDDIVKALSANCDQYLFQCRSALFHLSRFRDGSLPLEGPSGDDVSSFCTASYNIASVITILQTNRSLPDRVSSDTRNRLCMLIDSLSDSVTAIPDRDFMPLAQGSSGFASVCDARCAFLFAVEELRALAYTVHPDTDTAARVCLGDSFEALLENIREAIRRVSDAPGVTARASWHCTLANKALASIQAMFENYVNGTHARDSDLSDEMYMSTTILSAYTAANSLFYSCISAPSELPYVPSIIECSSALYDLYSHLSATFIDLAVADPHDGNNILSALNKAREALGKVDRSTLPSNRDAETYDRLRKAIEQASGRCIMRQLEHDYLDLAPSTGQNDLSIEGLGAAGASHDLHH
ncbi:hypothetical protein O997_03900 [Anaplasma phagocytophilum str. MRK]|uniref:hypothetical protein n=1 Tax=Anaplasma phagocytophilum TaxID=948 RepID=UPI00053396AC|nr:hypothetical protein [Anaplasma phagocytophilum]KDB56288.1 hypothetical protein O997_03900 [Anaplasma phagocytophilum str. MRK]